ncbi:MAG TPA: helix-turn-helix domain-containing protein [Burkholderiales bacterium]|nr:helix-turn-helix domain-containing protein [Burkholderiales bacterium]
MPALAPSDAIAVTAAGARTQPLRAQSDPRLHDIFQRAAGRPTCSPRRLKKGERLFHPGERFTAIYAVQRGSFKTSVSDEAREQVLGFFMVGDALGLDSLDTGWHGVAAIALEDSEVYIIPLAMLEHTAHEDLSLHRALNAELAREIVRNHGVMMLLGSMSAAQRVAAFLIGLSERFVSRGYSPREFHLRMTRREIASYLGLKMETVSRVFSGLARDGLIAVDQKRVRILDIAGLRRGLTA